MALYFVGKGGTQYASASGTVPPLPGEYGKLMQSGQIRSDQISHSVVSDSVRPYGQQPTRLLCPRDSLDKNTGVGCHFLLHCHCPCSAPISSQRWAALSFPGGSEVKASASNAGDPGSIPGSGRAPGEGNGKPLQYSCLENPVDESLENPMD